MEKSEPKVYITRKKAHKDAIISITLDPQDLSNNFFATSSEDQTLRIWDLRLSSSVKLFAFNKEKFKENADIGNVVYNGNGDIVVSRGKQIVVFDARTDKIIINSEKSSFLWDNDEINQVVIDKNFKHLAFCDDLGNTTVLDAKTYEKTAFLGNQHANISYSLDFVYGKSETSPPYCVTSGFDCLLIYWDLEKKFPLKHVNLNEVAQKFIQGKLLCPPLIYSVQGNQKSLSLVSCETGHIFALNFKEPKKPKFIVDAHLGKVIRSAFARFSNNNSMFVSVSNDLSFALWEIIKDKPKFLRRVEIPNKPNWIETSKSNKIFIADVSSDLLIYELKE